MLATLAVLLAAGALVVSLVREPKVETTTAPPPPTPQPTAAANEIFNDAADKPLCEAIAPLMRGLVEQNRAYAAFKPGSPEQGNVIPSYRRFVEDWARAVQLELNKHANPSRFLTRTLQAYVDDKLLYVELVMPGQVETYDEATWIQGAVDYGGALATCSRLGILWQ